MNRSISISLPHHTAVQSELFPQDNCEAGGIMLFGTSEVTAANRADALERRYLSHKFEAIQPEDVESSSGSHFSWRKAQFLRLLKRAMSENLAIGFIHSHRGVPAFFSNVDDINDVEVAELVRNRSRSSVEYLSIVTDEQGNYVGRYIGENGESNTVSKCSIWGNQWCVGYGSVVRDPETEFDRQSLAFGPTFLKSLKHMHIGIVGAGATGSATAVLLARCGAGRLSLIDSDIVEASNLSRLHGSTAADAAASNSKVDVLARHIEGFGLRTRVEVYAVQCGHESVRSVLKSCDILCGCTDDHSGRLLLNRLSYFYNTPVVDMGITIDPHPSIEGRVQSADVRVTVVGPGLPCLVCRGVVDPIVARNEDLFRADPSGAERLAAEGYIPGHTVRDPAVITLTTSAACMAVDEIAARLTGYRSSTDNKVRKFHLERDVRPGPRNGDGCGVCGVAGNWGRGDIVPFLDRVGVT